MLLTIQNDFLRLTVDTLGAQMMSLQRDGLEYLWQGDARYWPDRAPTLFPFIGRLTGNSYKYRGKTYPMGIHGFAASSEFSLLEQSGEKLVLSLGSSASTLAQYPVAFSLEIAFRLKEDLVDITYLVRNLDNKTMSFGIGGHPGFRVPLEEGERFEDYYLEFSESCQPDRVGFTPAVYLSGQDEAYPLKDGRYLPLHHALFDQDAVILKNMAREVTLRSRVSPHAVTVSYPRMPYLGIWHWPHTDAPYVCIEPWSSLPARQDIIEEFTCKSDLIPLEPGKTYENSWTIRLQ